MALQTAEEDHLGFIIFADGPLESGDCIVRALPRQAALFETKEFRFLADYQDAGELKFRFEADKNKLHVRKDASELFFEKNSLNAKYSEINSGLSLFGILVEDGQ